jgi:cob(I)alamin adenosyltransferase
MPVLQRLNLERSIALELVHWVLPPFLRGTAQAAAALNPARRFGRRAEVVWVFK